MTTSPTCTGISYLIDVIRSSDLIKKDIPNYQFTAALREGVRTEPDKFPDLATELIARLQRSRGWPVERSRIEALRMLAWETIMVDYNLTDPRAIYRFAALSGQEGSPEDYFYFPDAYGPAMKLLAQYVGVKEGSALAGFIFREDIH